MVVALGAGYASLQPYAKRSGAVVAEPALTLPTVAPSSSPLPVSRGQLGAHPRLVVSGNVLLASGDNVLLDSDNGGSTFRTISLPAGAAGLVIAPSDPQRRLTGGSTVRVSDDGGSTWRLPVTNPPGPGPYAPLAISPSDRDVWFSAAHGRLLRTRDGGVSWREIAGLSTDANTIVVPTGRAGEFVVSSAGHVYEFTDNGQQIRARSGLPNLVDIVELAVVATDPSIVLVAQGADGKDYVDTGDGWRSTVPLAGPVAAIPGKFMVVGDGGNGRAPAQTEASTDLGKTWSEGQNLPVAESIDALGASSGAGSAYAYTYGGSVLKSSDGIIWTQVSVVLRS